MKFYLPNAEKNGGENEGDDAEEKVGEEGEDDQPNMTPAEKFHKAIRDNAEIGKYAGDNIASFSDLHCLHPR